MIGAYERRYKRELYDLGVATALAQHDPQRLEKTFAARAPVKETDTMTKKWWGK